MSTRSGTTRRWSPRRARRGLVALSLGAVLVGLGGFGLLPAHAQDATQTGETLFGNYDLESRGLGVETRYEVEGLLPGGAPVLDFTVPETLARFGSGPTGYGLASLAYPGGLIVNLGSLLAQSGVDASSVPDYPIKAEAFYPSGPTDVHASAVGDQNVHTNNLGVQAQGTFPSLDSDPVISVGSLTSASQSDIEDGKAVSRTRVVLGNVNILGGLISFGTLTTDLVAAHDGTTGSTGGGTTFTGVKFLGLAASITKDGLVLDKAPAPTGPAAAAGSPLGQLLGPLQQLTAPVQQLLSGVLNQAVPSLNNVLSAAGIHIGLVSAGPVQTDSGAAAYKSSGLEIGFAYKGTEQTQLANLIASIPPDLRPSLGPLPNPLAFLNDNHIAAVTLGQGTVSALASPPFGSDDGSAVGGDLGDSGSFGDGGSFDSPGFSTPLPNLPPASHGGGGTTDLSGALQALAAHAVPGGAFALLLVGAALLAIGTTRLADNVLAPVSTSCPSGLDQPPAPPGDP